MESEVGKEALPAWRLAMRLKWDVFLSFRGEDTRHGFTTALYKALGESRVRTFMDSEGLRGGDEIDPSLDEAIHDSAAAIAVISPRYADSHWCLEELARLFQCKKLIVPVFYRVHPSHVEEQIGTFHVVKGEHTHEQVQRWKQALTMVGRRSESGFVLGEHSDESHTIKMIVARISAELSRIPVHDVAYPVGLSSRVDEVIDLLNLQSNDVRFLGIFGQPGIGKTTLAKAVFSRLVANFRRHCFISNFNETMEREDGFIIIQNKLLSDLSLEEGRGPVSIDYVNDGKSTFERMLISENQSQDKRVLVVVDDVVDANQLEGIGLKRELFSDGSRILATSRDKDVLLSSSSENELYEAKKLIESEARELFSYHALGRKKATEEFSTLSDKIISFIGGLPLAIEVFGSMLLDKRTTSEWEKCLEKLVQIGPCSLQKVLKISYDELDPEDKPIFLDISCLFVQVGMKREDAIDIINGCGFTGEEAIQLLMKRSLLKITQDGVLWMHDQTRDMGRQIAIDEGVSRLWNYDDILNVLKNNTGKIVNVRGIILDTGGKRLMVNGIVSRISSLLNVWKTEDSYINMKSFRTMATLKLMHINEVEFKGDLNYIHMLTQLRWLRWKGCPWKSLPSSLPKEIRVLDLSESKLECLWGPKLECCKKYQVAKNLTVLNLSNCQYLTSIPNLSGHCFIKKINLEGCVQLNTIHESLGHMTSLVHLNLRRCIRLMELPGDISGLKCLEELILSECRALSKLPCDFRSLTSLRELHLDDTAIRELPSLFHLTSVELMMLNRCIQLKCLPEDMINMRALKILSLSGSGIEKLPGSIVHLECLEQLNLDNCKSLQVIPNFCWKDQVIVQAKDEPC